MQIVDLVLGVCVWSVESQVSSVTMCKSVATHKLPSVVGFNFVVVEAKFEI